MIYTNSVKIKKVSNIFEKCPVLSLAFSELRT